MNKYDFTSLVKNPKNLGTQDAEALKLLVAEFPYFSLGQNLLVKALHNTKHYDYDKFLKQAALQAGDRAVLYNLVHDLPVETESPEMLKEAVALKISMPVVDKPKVFSEPIHEIKTAPIPKPDPPVEVPEVAAVKTSEKETITPQETEKESLNIEENISTIKTVNSEIEQVENIQITQPTSIVEPVKPTRLIIPDPGTESDPEPLPTITKIAKEIGAEEKLMESSGNLVRYIPKNPSPPSLKKEESMVTAKDPKARILQDFDISSLEDISVSETGNSLSKNNLSAKIKKEDDKQLSEDVDGSNDLATEVLKDGMSLKTDSVPENNVKVGNPAMEFRPETENTKSVGAQIIPEERIYNKVPESNSSESNFPDKDERDHQKITANSHNEKSGVETIIPDSQNNSSTDIDFIYWLNKKQTVNGEVSLPPPVESDPTNHTSTKENQPQPEPEAVELNEILREAEAKPKIIEDDAFVEAFQSRLSDKTYLLLQKEIQETLAAEVLIQNPDAIYENDKISDGEVERETEIISVDEEVNEGVLPLAESLNKEFDAFDFFTRPQHEDATAGDDLLNSLRNYEINEYLAPIYTQVTYNNQLFEDSFGIVFFKNAILKPKSISKLAAPYVILEPKPDETVAIQNTHDKSHKIKTNVNPPNINRTVPAAESILDKFIRENPTIARPKSEFYSPLNMAKQSAEDNNEMVSETLARIYTQQALYKKAISMYEKLGLLYPDKLSYFAGLINQIKSVHNLE